MADLNEIEGKSTKALEQLLLEDKIRKSSDEKREIGKVKEAKMASRANKDMT